MLFLAINQGEVEIINQINGVIALMPHNRFKFATVGNFSITALAVGRVDFS